MVQRDEFLSMVLPPLQTGEHYCSWGNKRVNGEEKDKVRQQFASSLQELSDQGDELQSKGFNVFFGLASFGPRDNGRYATNAIALKSFFIDLDCGPNKPYASLDDGLGALRAFCKNTGLPKPTIVKSGRGAHVYWALEQAVSRQEWKPHAERLKQLCEEHGFHVDYAVPADAARVLRMVGTNHLKDPSNPIPVEVLCLTPAVPNARLLSLLEPTQDVLSVLDRAENKRTTDPLTMALMGATESIFKNIVIKSFDGSGCEQIKHIVENQATLEEPLWRAGLSIAQHCSDRDKAIHAISKKHPEYNSATTERKAAETKGPYTCETFRKLNPDGCKDCKHKITSPIQLGRVFLEATEADSMVTELEAQTKEVKTYSIPKFPFPFFRGKNGGVFVHSKNKDDADVDEIVYPYDFYVVKRMQDPDIGETILLRLHLPKDGVRDFIMPLANAMSKERFVNTVAANGITVLGKKQETLMHYVAKWVEDLQSKATAEKAHKQFGWVEDESAIIIGDREIRAIETVYSPPSAPTLPNVALFQPKGDFHVWRDVINAYGRPGMEDRAFGFFMGFGSLLMRFTALDGFLLNLVSRESGSGKTTILQAINSIYGRPKDLLLSPKDTYNSKMQRIGVMQNLAVTLDEITNMPPDQLSQLAYDVTSGRGKNRLKQHDNAERLNHTKWSTGVVTSSNRYITDALLSIKNFPDGELKRILEVNIKPDPNDDPAWARAHFGRLMENYGHAIEPFCRVLVEQLPMARAKLDDMQARFDRAANIRNSERYWAMMASLSLTGGAIAGHLGLHNIPVKPVFEFAANLINSSRARARDYMFDSDEFLGAFLQRHYFEILVINGKKDNRTGLDYAPIREPRGALTARYEPDTKMLYVVLRTFRDDCAKVMANFEETIAPYKKNKSLVDIRKKRMTAGTVANMQAPVNALCFDTSKLEFFSERILLDRDEDMEPAAGGGVE